MPKSHPVHFQDYQPLSSLIADRQYSKVVVLVDDNTSHLCLPTLREHIETIEIIEIRSGEIHKNIATCTMIWQRMQDLGVDRHSLVINLGGGVIGDMGGFCAATYMRGIDFVQIPTTLLAQVDASVGGKLGVDLNASKNMVGLIQDPAMVIIDTTYLKTLPSKQLRSGYAEVLKHGLITDANYWNQHAITEWKGTSDWTSTVKASVDIKQSIVSEDPTEKGLRKVLNYGHTVGHAIESYHLGSDSQLLHGEAIAIGMVCEAYMSYKLTGLSEASLRSITEGIIDIFGHHPSSVVDGKYLMPLIAMDKKNKGAIIRCTLLKAIGEAVYDQPITHEDIAEALAYYRDL
jgi:3-dehydroquinate synthase